MRPVTLGVRRAARDLEEIARAQVSGFSTHREPELAADHQAARIERVHVLGDLLAGRPVAHHHLVVAEAACLGGVLLERGKGPGRASRGVGARMVPRDVSRTNE